MKAAVLVFAFGVAGCAAQGTQNVPAGGGKAQSATGPMLQAPTFRHPMDVIGGPASRTMLTSMGDAAPVLGGKTLAHFYVGVREIDALSNGQTTVLGSSATPVQVDLLQYQNGSTAWMTQTSVPAQAYSQMRYVIDLNSTQAIFADGSSLPVKFSGGYSKSSYGVGNNTATTLDATYANAIDVTVNAPIDAQATSVAADFNLTESLTLNGYTITMRPTLTAAENPAQINGTVVNASGAPVQNATVVAVASNGNAVTSATTDASGAFNLHALAGDTYQLVIYNVYSNAAGNKIYASGNTNGAQGFYGPTVSVGSGAVASAGAIAD
jgi:hypothetical protein